MNATVTKVKAALTKNKAVLGGLGVVAVAALAWRARSTSTGTPAASSAAATTTPAYYSTGGQSAGATGYDSSASDVYNALQPQLEGVGNAVQSLRDLMGQQTTTPIPVPAPAPAPTPVSGWGGERRDAIAGYYRTILGRAPELAGLNAWDRTGADLNAIRTGILRSKEAGGA